MYLLNRLILFTLLAVLTFTSCNNDDIIDPTSNPQESASVQNVISSIDDLYDDEGIAIATQNPANNIIFDFCFDFVYPIELIYNNGTTVSVESLQDLILVIINSTNDLFIIGIEFPFDVEVYDPATNSIVIQTINNEDEFVNLLESCFVNDCTCTDEYDPVCVEIQTDNGIVIVTYPNECEAECDGFTEDDWFECDDDCDCNDDYNPVCVETPNGGVIEFDNICLAFCEGFTQGDLVDCPSNDECVVDELVIVVGECNTDGTYSITIDFEYENADNDLFDVFAANGENIGTFELDALPVTIENYEPNGLDFDLVTVCINDMPNCCNEAEWEVPVCNDGECSITNLEVAPGDCNQSGNYDITISFDFENPGNDLFDVFNGAGNIIGTYELANLPVTIENYEPNGLDFDSITVCINDQQNCCNAVEWEVPNCNADPCDCDNNYDPVCVEVDGQLITYHNACYAECDGWGPSDFEACNNECMDCENDPYEPICVEFGGTILTMYNECYLFCNGFTPNNIVDCN